LSAAPSYWGSWKGKVLKAIAIDGSRTWREIRISTGLESDELNRALKELFDLDKLSKSGDKYWIEDYELYREYVEYGSQISGSSSPAESNMPIIKPEGRKKIQKYLDYMNENSKRAKGSIIGHVALRGFQNEGFDPYSEHFFIEGDALDRLSKDVIENSKKRVVVVNPYVDKCSLSDKLRDVCSSREVFLITRSPDLERAGHGREQKRAYHRGLTQSGVQIFYNDYVHAKLLVVDDVVALVSSMNFISSSSGGKSWEAGLVTWKEGTVNSIAKSIQNIMGAPETRIG
jgi:phosphatidylserine/phosphatidylglycerophosphate/cardiolipin synthase-like enzyme